MKKNKKDGFKIQFVDKKFCTKNNLLLDVSEREFEKENKKYYQEIEDYDWVKIVDHFKGLEAILHYLREVQTIKLVKKYARLPDGSRGNKYLDAGCGTGLITRHLPKNSIGLDINPRNIQKAKVHALNAKFFLGDIEKMPFKDNSFSAVISTEVLEHLITPQKAIKEISRVLDQKGIFIGSVPAKNPIWNLRFLSSTHPGEPYHRLYKRNEIKKILENNFKLIKFGKGTMGMNFFFVAEKK